LYNMIYFFFQAEDGIRDFHVTGVQTCALPILSPVAVLIPLKNSSYSLLKSLAIVVCVTAPVVYVAVTGSAMVSLKITVPNTVSRSYLESSISSMPDLNTTAVRL